MFGSLDSNSANVWLERRDTSCSHLFAGRTFSFSKAWVSFEAFDGECGTQRFLREHSRVSVWVRSTADFGSEGPDRSALHYGTALYSQDRNCPSGVERYGLTREKRR